MPSSSSEHDFVELLEARVTPAVYFSDVPDGDPTIVDHSTLTYRDWDGDMVTVKFSKNILDSQETVDAIFDFSEPFELEGGLKGHRLAGISLENFEGNPKLLKKLDITITAEYVPVQGGDTASGEAKFQGNGLADVGFIDATETDLRHVSVDGNLEKILCGDAKVSTPGLRSLEVQSLGKHFDLQGSMPEMPISVIHGALKELDVKGRIMGTVVQVEGGKHGDISKVHVGDGIIPRGFYGYLGVFDLEGSLGKVNITGHELHGPYSDGPIGSSGLGWPVDLKPIKVKRG